MLTRILMNAADSSPGGGSAPTTPAQPAQPDPQAQGNVVTREELKAFAKELRDGIFADFRKAGVFEQKGSKSTASPAPAPTDTTATTQATAPVVDLVRLRELDRAIAASGQKVNATAWKRLERDFLNEAPADPDEWLRDYFDGMGLAKPQPTNQGAVQAPAPRNDNPVTARGTPPAPKVPDNEIDLLALSPAERIELAKRLKPKEFKELFTNAIKDKRFALR